MNYVASGKFTAFLICLEPTFYSTQVEHANQYTTTRVEDTAVTDWLIGV